MIYRAIIGPLYLNDGTSIQLGLYDHPRDPEWRFWQVSYNVYFETVVESLRLHADLDTLDAFSPPGGRILSSPE